MIKEKYGFKVGDYVKNFRYEALKDKDRESGKFIYRISAIVEDINTYEIIFILQSMFGKQDRYYAINEMKFLRPVDLNKFPSVKQHGEYEKCFYIKNIK